MGKNLREIEYDELSELLQAYLDQGETESALNYCKKIGEAGNPHGYMFMGFIYEEGHGVVEINYKKALYCYEKAQELGADLSKDISRVKERINKLEMYIQTMNKKDF